MATAATTTRPPIIVPAISPLPSPAPRRGGHMLFGRCACNFAEYPMALGSILSVVAAVYSGAQGAASGNQQDYAEAGVWGIVAVCCMIGQCLVRKYGDIGLIADRIQNAADRVGVAAEDEAAAVTGLDKAERGVADVVNTEGKEVAQVGANTDALMIRITTFEKEAEELRSNIASLTTINAQLQTELAEFKRELVTFKQGLASFHEENEAAKRELEILEGELPHLKDDAESMEVSVGRLGVWLSSELEKLKTMQAGFQTIFVQLQEQATASIQESQTVQQALQEQISKTSEIESRLTSEMEALRVERTTLIAELDRVKGEFTSLQASINTMIVSLRQASGSVKEASAQEASVAAEMHQRAAHIDDALRGQVSTLEGVLAAMKANNDAFARAAAAAKAAQQHSGGT